MLNCNFAWRRIVGGIILPVMGTADTGGNCTHCTGSPHVLALEGWYIMKIVVVKSPRFLVPLLRLIFRIKKDD